ncbi:MAG: tetratricopeptide repeat protein [Planctomycetaceae bacterium]
MSVGCSGLKKKQNDGLVKPLAAVSNEAPTRPQPFRDERALCMETAQTVAEQGHAHEAIKLYLRAEQLGPSQLPLDRQLAPLHAQTGDFDAALQRYARLVSEAPEDADLCNNFAWTLMEAQRYGDAISQARRGLSIDADNTRLRSTLAMIHYRQGDPSSALAEFATAKNSTAAHHNLAVLDIDAGNLSSAQEHLRKASKTAAENPDEASLKTEALLTALNQESAIR